MNLTKNKLTANWKSVLKQYLHHRCTSCDHLGPQGVFKYMNSTCFSFVPMIWVFKCSINAISQIRCERRFLSLRTFSAWSCLKPVCIIHMEVSFRVLPKLSFFPHFSWVLGSPADTLQSIHYTWFVLDLCHFTRCQILSATGRKISMSSMPCDLLFNLTLG